ncbi:hypothetical protein SAMN04488066_105168 [Halorubrum aquaticum]|uniref:Uncharacterized protein n=1 Tax=Halorubrum aquaticum TaxID=387340 RepID=A0A1I3AHE4_9EURY|nr:hypothetical protein [Halorubrum aquaticum]SFH48761.1 hypothetical protein SAMN04488066_105168 [Halorubrum aquaticum]
MERRKFVIGVGSLAAGGAAATGTGAFTAAELNGRTATIGVVDDTQGLIGLKAGDSELVTDSGGDTGDELQIDFDTGVNGKDTGVNPNSTYQVGGLGGVPSLDTLPGDPPAEDAAADLAIDTETSIEEEYAFQLLNQSGSDQNVEITYEANDAFPDNASLYMISHYDEPADDNNSALVASSEPDARRASILYTDDPDVNWSTDVDSGHSIEVTIIVEVGEVGSGESLGGTLVVRAGSHDEFTDDPESA